MIIIILLCSVNGFCQLSLTPCDGIQKKLQNLTLSSNDAGERIAYLFQIGDECITELIVELKNDDSQISHNARLIMMYLRNKVGLKDLDAWQQENEKTVLYLNPIPRFLPKSQRKLTFKESDDLAKQVANKIFVNKNFRKFHIEEDIKSRLLGFNGARNKMVIEVDIADQVTHHIVLVKRKTVWSPLIIVLVSRT